MKFPWKKSLSGQQVETGIAWYRREQWDRLRQISEDSDQLEETYDEWLAFASEKLAELKAHGMRIEKVDLDVNELLAYCGVRGLPINASSRSEFVTHILQSRSRRKKNA